MNININRDYFSENVIMQPQRKRNKYLKIMSQRYYVGDLYPGIYLTSRELEIGILLMQGYRYKEIGQHLSLSPRTIEYYIGHLKTKFQCTCKKTLIKVLEKIDIV